MEQTERLFTDTTKYRLFADRIKQSFSGLRRTQKRKMLGLRFAISLKKKAEKHSASTCVSTRKNDIHNSFEKYMLEELRILIAEEVISQCHGCQIDHPSQKQHELKQKSLTF